MIEIYNKTMDIINLFNLEISVVVQASIKILNILRTHIRKERLYNEEQEPTCLLSIRCMLTYS